MKLKHVLVVSLLAGVAQVALARSHAQTYPLQPVLDAAQGDNTVQLYFADAAHPAVVSDLGNETKSIRVVRQLEGEAEACNKAMTQALRELREYARDHGATAVIGIQTRFHETHSTTATEFACGTSMSAAALKIQGELVKFDAK